jgi:glycosyltransferase involved in cell wall biosynthesis
MFTNTYLPHVGGVARSVDFFTEDLRKLNHRVLVVAPTFPENMNETNEKSRVLRVPAVQNFNGSDFSVRIPMPFIIAQNIDEFDPDVIHSHHPFLMGDTALRTARKRNLPLVFTHHTLYENYTHYVPLDSEPLKKFVIELSTRYANFCDRIVVPSRSIARLIRRRGVKRPIAEIPTGVDLKFFARGGRNRFRRAHGIPENARVIGHLGRLAPEKNLTYLTEAVAEFICRRRHTLFFLVGAGPAEGEISRVFEKMNLGRNLIMPGSQSGQDLSDAYSAMDLFVFSSRSETQGMVLLEAMAAGKPVIALDASGVREIVNDGQNGRLLPANASPRKFADAIQKFFQDPVMADHWRRRAVATAQNFSRETCARRLENLYHSVLDEHSKADIKKMPDELIPWDSLLESVRVEWDLLYQKTTAAVDAIRAP